VLRPLQDIFPSGDFPDLLVGLENPDDAAVYRINDDVAVVSTVDFFPPVVDDPYSFGAIAAANALSDVYAMGAKPVLAINLAAYPDGNDLSILSEILRGGAEKVKEAGAVVSGGHTITDREPKYGLAVTGLVAPADLVLKQGALVGDQLVLTKPLGTGVITTAIRNGHADPAHTAPVIEGMSVLNSAASELAVQYNRSSRVIHAMTDITGFGLLGHAHEMAHLSQVGMRIHVDALEWYPGALVYAERDLFPSGMTRNREYFEPWVRAESIALHLLKLAYDPQTSGGLLLSIDAQMAAQFVSQLRVRGIQAVIMGEVIESAGLIELV
jgi:selenide,water dikinase